MATPSLAINCLEELEKNPGPDVDEQENNIKMAAGTLYIGETLIQVFACPHY